MVLSAKRSIGVGFRLGLSPSFSAGLFVSFVSLVLLVSLVLKSCGASAPRLLPEEAQPFSGRSRFTWPILRPGLASRLP